MPTQFNNENCAFAAHCNVASSRRHASVQAKPPRTPREVCRASPLLLPYECRTVATAAIEENDRNRQAHTSQLIFGRFCSRKRLDGKK